MTELDRLAITAIRALAMDAVEQANSGHPGTPMGLAPLGYRLFTRLLRHNPADPLWPDRDRFVLSCGHASMLLYALLHLTGYEVSVDDLGRFRQLGSITPGHPERGVTPGVEVSTGPLGQGLGNAVGMALAERMLAHRFGRPDHPIVDHRTVVVASDGDVMEGISHEAGSLAGHLGLDRLIVFYDDNHTTIDGPTSITFSDETAARFRAYHWRTLDIPDVNDLDHLDAVLDEAEQPDGRPTLVRVGSVIAYGAPTKAGTSAAHGAPLGAAEVAAAKRALGWPHEPFVIPVEIRRHCDQRTRGAGLQDAWRRRLEAYRAAYPDLADEFDRVLAGRLPPDWDHELATVDTEQAVATRESGHAALNALAARVPELVGGAADLASSNRTRIDGGSVARADFRGRNVHFGVREHVMGAVLNGLAIHGGFRVFGSTFLVFTDYLRPALRMAAMMGLPVVFVTTHDSIAIGEDGPTHQPVEHLAALRAIPNLHVVRPADARETVGAWRHALRRRDGPTVLVLSRQALPPLAGSDPDAVGIGACVLRAPDRPADLVLVGTGSEVHLAVAAAEQLENDGLGVQVVSMPCWETFAAQPESRRCEVLPASVPILAVEAAHRLGWERWADEIVHVDGFGASGTGPDVLVSRGLTPEAIATRARDLLVRQATSDPAGHAD